MVADKHSLIDLNDSSSLQQASLCADDTLKFRIELPVVPEAYILLGYIRHADEISKRLNKPIRLFSFNALREIEKFFLGLLSNYDNIFYTNIEE